MSTWESAVQHAEAELRLYFGGELEGAMGVTSWLGSFMEYGIALDAQTISTDARGLWAVRVERRVRDTLARLPRLHREALRASYVPIPPNYPHGLTGLGASRLVQVLVADELGGAAHLRELLEHVAGGDTRARRRARKELGVIAARAAGLVHEARDAYAEALLEGKREARRGRRGAFRAGLGLK